MQKYINSKRLSLNHLSFSSIASHFLLELLACLTTDVSEVLVVHAVILTVRMTTDVRSLHAIIWCTFEFRAGTFAAVVYKATTLGHFIARRTGDVFRGT